MKKYLAWIFLMLIWLAVPNEANATATLYMGGITGGTETVADNYTFNYYSGGISYTVIEFTYLNKLKIDIQSQTGESKYYWQRSMDLGIVKIGYPVLDKKSGLIFMTAGYLSCKRNQISEARGLMLGADLIYIATDNLYMELDLQYSTFGASSQRYYPAYRDFPTDLLSIKVKAQYIITDHLGIVAGYQWIHVDANGGLIVEDILTPSLGLIYRF